MLCHHQKHLSIIIPEQNIQTFSTVHGNIIFMHYTAHQSNLSRYIIWSLSGVLVHTLKKYVAQTYWHFFWKIQITLLKFQIVVRKKIIFQPQLVSCFLYIHVEFTTYSHSGWLEKRPPTDIIVLLGEKMDSLFHNVIFQFFPNFGKNKVINVHIKYEWPKIFCLYFFFYGLATRY